MKAPDPQGHSNPRPQTRNPETLKRPLNHAKALKQPYRTRIKAKASRGQVIDYPQKPNRDTLEGLRRALNPKRQTLESLGQIGQQQNQSPATGACPRPCLLLHAALSCEWGLGFPSLRLELRPRNPVMGIPGLRCGGLYKEVSQCGKGPMISG